MKKLILSKTGKTVGAIGGTGSVGAAILWLLIEFLSSSPVDARQEEKILQNKSSIVEIKSLIKEVKEQTIANGKAISKLSGKVEGLYNLN